MKQAIILSILLLSVNSFACENYEAQFVGHVTVVDDISENGCKLSVDFDLFNEHFFCPLLQEDVDRLKVTADKETCEALSNSRVSGILSWDIETDLITIEQ